MANTKKHKSLFSLHAWGGAGTVTGANFEIRTPKSRVLVDCGLIQGTPQMEELNKRPFQYDPKSISALLVTHAHMDHIGRIPKLVKEGFNAPIYSTKETKAVAEIVLQDALHIAISHAKELNTAPLYEEADLKKTLSLWRTLPFHSSTIITEDISVVAYDAGHILGSCMYWMTITHGSEHKSILFSGDLGNSPSPLLKDLEIPPGPDYLLMESVYGDKNHEGTESRVRNFKRIINESIENGGVVLIPAFSIERTQIVLSLLNDMVENDHFKAPIFLDSPLAIHVTRVYEKMHAIFNEDAKREMAEKDGLFRFKTLKESVREEDSRSIAGYSGPKVIIAGSGMSNGGRILHHEKKYLPDFTTTVLLMGYQAPGTIGRLLEEGAKKISIWNENIAVNAKIVSVHGFSGHADSDHLLGFVHDLTPAPKTVFLAMGESKASNFLAQRIRDILNIKAKVMFENENEEL